MSEILLLLLLLVLRLLLLPLVLLPMCVPYGPPCPLLLLLSVLSRTFTCLPISTQLFPLILQFPLWLPPLLLLLLPVLPLLPQLQHLLLQLLLVVLGSPQLRLHHKVMQRLLPGVMAVALCLGVLSCIYQLLKLLLAELSKPVLCCIVMFCLLLLLLLLLRLLRLLFMPLLTPRLLLLH
jgi:hypothetical protein